MGLGKLTSLPSSGKSGPGSSLCLIRGGRGCRAPLHPIPSGQAGRGRGSDSWGRAGLGSLSISPPLGQPPAAPPPPPRRGPHLFPTQLGAARAQGRVSRLRGVRAPQPALAGTKCAGLGPAPPGAAPAGSLQTQSEPVSGRESARARELVWSRAQPPPASPGSARHLPVRPGRSVRAPARQPARGMGLARVAQPGPAAARWGCPSAPPSAAQLRGVLPPRRAGRRAP